MLADERESALRWSAAVVEHEDSVPSAPDPDVTPARRLRPHRGRHRGLRARSARAIDSGNLPLAVAAVADLRKLGVHVDDHVDEVAAAFCAGSTRLTEAAPPPPPLPPFKKFQPLSSFLTGPALLSKATQIIHEARQKYESDGAAETLVAPLPLFSALEKDGLRALIAAFEMITVPAGKEVIVQGEEGAEAYIVARGELEVRRVPDQSDDDGSRPAR